jgi:uncharacterized protein (TIRG00374 family)
MTIRPGALLRGALGVAISIAAIAFTLRGVDLAETWAILRGAAPGWLAVALGLFALDVLIRAVRWQRLVRPLGAVRFIPMLGYLLVGYLANNVLPARLGELVRSHYLGDREGISRASTLGTVVVERVVDIGVVVAIGAAAILVLRVRGVVASAVLVGAALTALLVVGLAIGIVAHRLPGAERIATFAERWPQVRSAVGRLRGGLAVAGRPRTLAEALGLSVAAWSVTTLAFAAVGQAIGLELRIADAALVASGVALATAIPSGPGYLGTFEFAAVQIAAALGLPPAPAFALALLAHATILVLTSVGGAVAFVRLGWRRTPKMLGAAVEDRVESAVGPVESADGPVESAEAAPTP